MLRRVEKAVEDICTVENEKVIFSERKMYLLNWLIFYVV